MDRKEFSHLDQLMDAYGACEPTPSTIEKTTISKRFFFKVQSSQESDGRYIAEIRDVVGALAYGSSRKDAIESVVYLATSILAGKRFNELQNPSGSSSPPA